MIILVGHLDPLFFSQKRNQKNGTFQFLKRRKKNFIYDLTRKVRQQKKCRPSRINRKNQENKTTTTTIKTLPEKIRNLFIFFWATIPRMIIMGVNNNDNLFNDDHDDDHNN